MPTPYIEEHRCEKCNGFSKVIDSRAKEGGWKRRRECLKCHNRWNTREIREDRLDGTPADLDKITKLMEELALVKRDSFRTAMALLDSFGIELDITEDDIS